ncbi:MAG: hypothetical protein J6Q13_01890 [Clostridia bacterium]|nr:hypothetical protein [Clostridia bacterium]
MSEEEYEDDDSELDQLIEQQELELQQLIAIQEMEEQAQMQAEFERKHQVEMKILRNKLRKILRDLGVTRTTLKEKEKKVIKQAKKFPALKKEIKMINTMLLINKTKNTSKMLSSSPALFYVAIGALIIFLIICIISVIGSILGTDGGKPSSQYGITGADFYGARMVYINDEKATQNMVEDYVEIVEKSIEEIQSINSATISSETYTFNAKVNIDLPTDYDYSTFTQETETAFASAELYSIILELSKVVYLADNGVAYSGTSLTESLNGAKYFGFANKDAFLTQLATSISSKISIENVKNFAGEVVDDSAIISQISNSIAENLKIELNSADYSNLFIRTEKLFVKDYILKTDDARISDIEEENYVAMIFMPKKNVTFTGFSFTISNTAFTDFKISMKVNGEDVEMTTDNANISMNEGEEAYIYSSGSVDFEVTAFDENNLNTLNEEMSLFDIVENVVDYSQYLQSSTDANSVEVWTYIHNGAVVQTENSEAFYLVEFETMWKSAS